MKKIIFLLAFLGWYTTLFAQNRLEDNKYIVSDSVMIKTKQGHILSATVVRRKDMTGPQPTALFFYIYSNTEAILREAKLAADHGYVGVVADTRGKRLSSEEVRPY